ncbi:hypothetical protein P168DRAFT_324209 [Aspergillus campestris IBT 28561]|uniref:Uncharacterized protein n=1 Tax=Aspergillus campestris (strain IBT 28561) TaxID=1392248 RepID=A0A2I1DH58_ASPC2|nr:uncharacterized protein P168DRAFT_324209 [Aspergillus campestris IBT 28561]PKY09207.1 hypothetical protein P168DRAFT_324209 [Aspergillus campestris IBT 28561]
MAMDPVEPRDRYNLRKALTIMERDIKALEKETLILDQSMLKRYRVQVLPLSLDANDSLAPKFFTSFAPEDMPEPTEEYVDNQYDNHNVTLSNEYGRLISIYLKSYVSELRFHFPEVSHTWSRYQIGDYIFGDDILYRVYEPEFGTLDIRHVSDGSKPHIKCIMHNDIDVDDSHLLYGELFTVIHIMLGQLKLKEFVDDMVAPVLLFSLNQQHPRIIEAYFDGQKLLVRRTNRYDFTFLNEAGFKTFAQWLMGDPIGDTSRNAVRT